MSNINDQLEIEMKDTTVNKGFDFYRMQDGDNKFRILSEGAVLAQHFFGKGQKPSVCYGISKGCPFHKETDLNPSIKYTCYILDRMDDTIKLADLPYSVIRSVGELQKDEDYSFDDFPMPYDIKVTYRKEEAPAKMYTVIASPKREPLSKDKLEKLDELMKKASPVDLVEKKKTAQMEAHIQQGIWIDPTTIKSDLSQEDIDKIKQLRENAMKKEPEIDISDIPF